MKDFKGTKGEWVIENRKSSNLKDISCREFTNYFVAESILEKDAQLISAAPDLLEALQECYKVLEYTVDGTLSLKMDEQELAFEQAKQAINKALGL
jgi:uncharacterized protein YgbK (DUF1537 family)